MAFDETDCHASRRNLARDVEMIQAIKVEGSNDWG